MVSEALPSSTGMRPALDTLLPIMPMHTATVMEITTHTAAMRRDSFSSFSSRMAMKRTRMWGMPKYPRPQASMEKMLMGG